MTVVEQYKDFVGKKIENSHMTILKIMPLRVDGKVMVECKCDCGRTKVVRLRHLQAGMTKSCGMCHFRAQAIHDRCALNLKGKRVGKLVVEEETDKRDNSFVVWKCRCDCGRSVEVNSRLLASEKVKSCGKCGYKAERIREAHTKYFSSDEKRLGVSIFCNMMGRCYNKSRREYPDYGGRGIYICDEWLKDRTKFVKWSLEHGYRSGLSIDRIDVNGPYSPENCRWVDILTQSNNKTDNRVIEVNDEKHTCADWARILGVAVRKFYNLKSDDHVVKRIRLLQKAKLEFGEQYKNFASEKNCDEYLYKVYQDIIKSGDTSKLPINPTSISRIETACARWDAYFNLPDGYTKSFYDQYGKDATDRMIENKMKGF